MSSLNSIWMLWARAESSSDQGMIFLVQSLTSGLWDLKSKSCDLTKCRRQAETSTWSQDPRQWCSLGKGEQRSAQELQGRSRHIQEKVEGKPQSCSHVSTWKPPRAPRVCQHKDVLAAQRGGAQESPLGSVLRENLFVYFRRTRWQSLKCHKK